MLHKISYKLKSIPLVWLFISGVTIWLFFISYMHFLLNTEHSERRIISMGYMPVITNLAAPILDHASKTTGDIRYKAIKYSSFADMAESLRNEQIDIAFMIAPLSIVLKQQGEDVRVVYIGNRHESTLVARKDLKVTRIEDLIGKTVAVPMRYSGHNLSILQLIEDSGLNGRINVVEMNPPDMASALSSGSLDAYYVGEPFAAQTLKSGESSLVKYVEDVWPDFMCNLVVVRQSLIDKDPAIVQRFVQSAARSGLWSQNNTKSAIKIAVKYWNQSEDLVEYALTTPKNRIVYDKYVPVVGEFKYMAEQMKRFKLVDSSNVDGLVYDQFAKSADISNLTTIESIISAQVN